jgi:ubiquitin fusion degradation protein 1
LTYHYILPFLEPGSVLHLPQRPFYWITFHSLESALRFYSTLTQGDIIEITYNSLTFDFLIITTTPAGPGISIIDTDLEVDFETPVGYVEPTRPEPKAIPTMAEKLNIDLSGTHTPSEGSEGGGGESFKGVGMSLSGKRVKGKGLGKKIEEMDGGKGRSR